MQRFFPHGKVGRRGADGFSLIELIVAVALVGFITVALSSVLIVFFRNTASTQARTTESQDIQITTAYWQRDVASMGLRSATVDQATGKYAIQSWADSAACSNLPAGYLPLVTFVWGEYTSTDPDAAATKVRVTYGYKTAGSGAAVVYTLGRARCGLNDSFVALADNLDDKPIVKCDNDATKCGSGSPMPHVVTLGLSAFDRSQNHTGSYTATLTGERRQTS